MKLESYYRVSNGQYLCNVKMIKQIMQFENYFKSTAIKPKP